MGLWRFIFRHRRAAGQRGRLGILVGLLVALVMVIVQGLDGLAALERMLLDGRFKYFSHFTPPPSDRVVHIDIDDESLQRTGRWPWARRDMARVVDELRRAGAAVIALDILFPEPQQPRFETAAPKAFTAGSNAEGDAGIDVNQVVRIDDDAVLADAFTKAGNIFLAIESKPADPPDPLMRRAMAHLGTDPSIDLDTLARHLTLTKEQKQQVGDRLPGLKRQVMRKALYDLLDRPDPLSFEQCRAELLPNVPAHVSESTDLDAMKEEYERARSTLLLSGLMPMRGEVARPFSAASDPLVPILPLAAATSGVGFVTYRADPDGVVRSVPTWVTYRDRLYPQLALAVACRYLDVALEDVVIQSDAVIIPDAHWPDSDERRTVRIPLLDAHTRAGERELPAQVLVPWPSSAPHWAYLYDPKGTEPKQHYPIGRLHDLSRMRDAIPHNQNQVDQAVLATAETIMPDKVEAYEHLLAGRPDAAAPTERIDEWTQQRDRLRTDVMAEGRFYLDEFNAVADDELLAEDRPIYDVLRRAVPAGEEALRRIQHNQRQIDDEQAKFQRAFGDRICLIGMTSTASHVDVVPTSLHAGCPGVIVHGALVNAILTDHFIARVPRWVDLLLVAMVGIGAAWIASRLAPATALIVTVVLAAGYYLVNGLLLFDWMNLWVAAAGPMAAATLVWASITVYRLMTEQRERARITRQFKNYVAPDLVDYLVDHPHLIRMEGQSRELTCLFSDIKGFTTISKKLGPEQTAKLLNRYLGLATEQLMAHRATVNKYLGDGIMAFWGAPIDNEHHAPDCCISALACIDALEQLNDDPMLAGMPSLFMRVGICTGPMMVGDFGAPPQRSDYTVIGDSVNLASRLEAANKQFDTQVLISSRTNELVNDQMLTRPIGRIVVVGRDEPEPVFELLNSNPQATDDQRQFAEATTRAVETYYRAAFTECIDQFQALSDQFGHTALVDRYIESCRQHLEQSTAPDLFDGSIILTEK